MGFVIKNRDELARIGYLKKENNKTITPEIIYISSKRIKPFKHAKIIISEKKINNDKISLIIENEKSFLKDYELIKNTKIENLTNSIKAVHNSLQLYNKPKKFIDFIYDFKEKNSTETAIYLPGIANLENIAFLSYISIDLFDSSQAIIAARNSNLFYESGKINIKNFKEIFCNCPICNKIEDKTEYNFDKILQHNYYMLDSEIKKIRNAINNSCLRNLVEKKVRSNPHLTTLLRYIDNNYYDLLEENTAITKNTTIICTSKDSINRAEIKRYQNRLLNNLRKPRSTKVLLLLPCSAKKPYSFSKSHKLFRNKILNSSNPYVIHELIITSPLGLVPRELELTYPASSYDISVTGVWEEYEKDMIINLLSKYLQVNKYGQIIAHLPKDIIDFIKPLIKESKITCLNHPTSKESLDKLGEVLTQIVKEYDKVSLKKKSFDEIYELASYQFDRKIAEKLLSNAEIKGKYPYRKIFEKNTQIGMISENRGLISLTLEGAKKIFDFKKYYVKIHDDFKIKGSILAPGVFDADENIRIGDEVLVIKNNSLEAVGTAQMNGQCMKNSSFGEAVKVRHKV